MSPKRTTLRRSDRLLQALRAYSSVLVIAHDNPDPDAVASGWAMAHVISSRLSTPVRFVACGVIMRAENRRLVELLRPPVELVDELPQVTNSACVFVDCSPEGTNQPEIARTRDAAVIDHHPASASRRRYLFRDVRPSAAATASLASQYLEHQNLTPDARLATALMYAIRTETSGGETSHSRLDRHAINWLTPLADPTLLAEIANAPLPAEYYGDLALALQNTFVYGDASITILPRARGPEIAAEVADLLIRAENMRRVLCAALVGENVVVSVRTRDGDDASTLVQKTLRGLGRGGGHAHRAGGRIRLGRRDGPLPESMEDQLRANWLSACDVAGEQESRLVPKREIVSNLK